jgi:hypothetical protein
MNGTCEEIVEVTMANENHNFIKIKPQFPGVKNPSACIIHELLEYEIIEADYEDWENDTKSFFGGKNVDVFMFNFSCPNNQNPYLTLKIRIKYTWFRMGRDQ